MWQEIGKIVVVKDGERVCLLLSLHFSTPGVLLHRSCLVFAVAAALVGSLMPWSSGPAEGFPLDDQLSGRNAWLSNDARDRIAVP